MSYSNTTWQCLAHWFDLQHTSLTSRILQVLVGGDALELDHLLEPLAHAVDEAGAVRSSHRLPLCINVATQLNRVLWPGLVHGQARLEPRPEVLDGVDIRAAGCQRRIHSVVNIAHSVLEVLAGLDMLRVSIFHHTKGSGSQAVLLLDAGAAGVDVSHHDAGVHVGVQILGRNAGALRGLEIVAVAVDNFKDLRLGPCEGGRERAHVKSV